MPTYDYFCEANGRKVEVRHRMSEELKNWGQLCDLAHLEPGDTPVDSPVRRLISGGTFISSTTRSNPEPTCSTGACCPGGVCGLPE
jgi:hypothetical protein